MMYPKVLLLMSDILTDALLTNYDVVLRIMSICTEMICVSYIFRYACIIAMYVHCRILFLYKVYEYVQCKVYPFY